jgi:triacylglycerol lipase
MTTHRPNWMTAATVGACVLVLFAGVSPAASETRTPLPVPYSFAAGIAAGITTPGAAPPGSNDFGCQPSAQHPNPVVLLHGFAANMTDSWQTVAPLLANHGYCVFALNYGTYPSIDPTLQLGGLDYIENSSAQLKEFVTRVLG